MPWDDASPNVSALRKYCKYLRPYAGFTDVVGTDRVYMIVEPFVTVFFPFAV
jgi:hypothetical protein